MVSLFGKPESGKSEKVGLGRFSAFFCSFFLLFLLFWNYKKLNFDSRLLVRLWRVKQISRIRVIFAFKLFHESDFEYKSNLLILNYCLFVFSNWMQFRFQFFFSGIFLSWAVQFVWWWNFILPKHEWSLYVHLQHFAAKMKSRRSFPWPLSAQFHFGNVCKKLTIFTLFWWRKIHDIFGQVLTHATYHPSS